MDAMEFLTFLLDHLHEEMRAVNEVSGSAGTESSQYATPTSNSTPTLEAFDASDSLDAGWSEVCRGGVTSKVDKSSRVESKAVNSSSIISRVYHGTLRYGVLWHDVM